MKKTIIYMLSLVLITSCQPSSSHRQLPAQQASPPVLVVHIDDFTQSGQALTYFDTSAARHLYKTIATWTHGTIKHIPITEASGTQDVFTVQVPRLDTTSILGISNIYEKGRAQARNKKTYAAFQAEAQEGIRQYCKQISKPRTSSLSDVAGALSLAAVALNQPNYRGYHKVLLVTSDMIQDVKAGHEKLNPVLLKNVVVLLVRPSLSLDQAKALFPDSEVYVFTSTIDAINTISFINNSKN